MKLISFEVEPKQGGFVVMVRFDDVNGHRNVDEYLVTSYAKLLKAFKEEFKSYKPVHKPKEIA